MFHAEREEEKYVSPKPSVRDTLTKYVRESQTGFAQYHSPRWGNDRNANGILTRSTRHQRTNYLKLLESFLLSTLDEVRHRKADEWAHYALSVADHQDLMYFRKQVGRRELSGTIDYEKQRDHSAHTTNNYLLGWYLFDKYDKIRVPMRRAIRRRLPHANDREANEFFGHAWHYVSLLHDIGYTCEGTIPALSFEGTTRPIALGASAIHDYFNYRFWFGLDLDTQEIREVLRLHGIQVPNFRAASLAELADLLCSTGDLCLLRDGITKGVLPDKMDVLPQDAFELWHLHYHQYEVKGRPSPSAENMRKLKQAFKAMVWDGYGKRGVRMLDHGVASGLILLNYAIFYYQLMMFSRMSLATGKDYARSKKVQEFVQKMLDYFGDEVDWRGSAKDYRKKDLFHSCDWWWKGVVWATGACAIHNVATLDDEIHGLGGSGGFSQCSLADDPLAYLGIMVDVLQAWDRYSVLPEDVFQGDLPLQGSDVSVTTDARHRVVVYLPTDAARTAKKMRDDLERALAERDKLVVISP